MNETAKATTRQQVTLKIKFKSQNLDQFIERYAVDVSRGGIFIRTKNPLPVGTPVKFEFQLQGGDPLLAGEGAVQWIREDDPSRQGVSPGMGLKFERLAGPSHDILERILAKKQSPAGEEMDDVATRVASSPALKVPTPPRGTPLPGPRPQAPPPRPAPPSLRSNPPTQPPRPPAAVAPPPIPTSKPAEGDHTPLPKPFAGDDWNDGAFSEPTRVASLSAEMAKAMTEGAEEGGATDENDGEATRVAPDSADMAKAMKGAMPPDPSPEPSAKVEVAPETVEKVQFRGANRAPEPGPLPGGPIEEDKPTVTKPPSPATLAAAAKDETTDLVAKQKAAGAASAVAVSRPAAKKKGVPWAAVLAALVVVGGGLGYVYYTQFMQKSRAAAAPAPGPAVAPPAQTVAAAAAPAAGTPTPPPADNGVPIAVASTPAGATILVDGAAKGTTPSTVRLPAGVAVKLALHLDGYKDFAQPLTPQANAPAINVTLVSLPWEVKVTTVPDGAHVIFDGHEQGRSPITRQFAAPSELPKTITLQTFGYVTTNVPVSPTSGWAYGAERNTLTVATTLAVDPNVHHGGHAAPANVQQVAQPTGTEAVPAGTPPEETNAVAPDQPVAAAPKTEPPKAEAPQTEPPKAEAPQAEPPKTEPPKTAQPEPPATPPATPGVKVPSWATGGH